MAPEDATGPGSALASAALHLVGSGVDAATLSARFAEAGARLEDGASARALADLAGLGLVRVARGADVGAQHVLTSLGQQALAGGLGGVPGAALAELERLRTDLLSTIAHELRTPLTAVRTSASILRDARSTPTDAQRDAMLATIERNADRMQRLVGDILDLARLRSGAIRLQLRPFDALVLARRVADTIGPLAEERGQRVEMIPDEPESDGLRVFGDRARLEQALLNLVSNAQRFAPDGGRVRIHVRQERDDALWAVSDDGPGIPPDDVARLFERFFVGRNDRHEAREGVGLGLPTALAIAQAHGGRIEVDSTPGRGSTFTLAVPVDGPPDHGDEH